LICKGPETDACLTKAQAESLKAIYTDTNLPDGKLVYHGLLPGGELGDNGWKELDHRGRAEQERGCGVL